MLQVNQWYEKKEKYDDAKYYNSVAIAARHALICVHRTSYYTRVKQRG